MPRRFISRTTSSPNGESPAVEGNVGRRVRPVVGAEVGQRQVADTQFVEHPQRGGGAFDGVAALETDHRRDSPRGVGALDVVRGAGELEVLIAIHEPVDDVDLADRLPERVPESRMKAVSTKADQNCMPTPPSRSRGMSAGNSSWTRFRSAPGASRSPRTTSSSELGRSLWPSAKGTLRSISRARSTSSGVIPGGKRLSGGGGAHGQSGEEGEKAMKGHGDPFPGRAGH